jgi:transcriptional regulator with XRE-family HTH domain
MPRLRRRTPPPPDSAAARLRTLRESAGLTQQQAADRLRVTSVYWGDVERGKRQASLDWLHAAALAIGVDPHELDPRLASNR